MIANGSYGIVNERSETHACMYGLTVCSSLVWVIVLGLPHTIRLCKSGSTESTISGLCASPRLACLCGTAVLTSLIKAVALLSLPAERLV